MEAETIGIWKDFLIDLEFNDFRRAVVHICKTRIEFYPGTNIPALIIESAKEFRAEDRRKENSFQVKFDQYKLEAATPEETQDFLNKAGFKMKGIPS